MRSVNFRPCGAVIPAKAGIFSGGDERYRVKQEDSRFRGNDGGGFRGNDGGGFRGNDGGGFRGNDGGGFRGNDGTAGPPS